jgi:hypothetical protein
MGRDASSKAKITGRRFPHAPWWIVAKKNKHIWHCLHIHGGRRPISSNSVNRTHGAPARAGSARRDWPPWTPLRPCRLPRRPGGMHSSTCSSAAWPPRATPWTNARVVFSFSRTVVTAPRRGTRRFAVPFPAETLSFLQSRRARLSWWLGA